MHLEAITRSREPITGIEFSIMGGITDDTQLTLATCEAIIESKKVNPERVARKFWNGITRAVFPVWGQVRCKRYGICKWVHIGPCRAGLAKMRRVTEPL